MRFLILPGPNAHHNLQCPKCGSDFDLRGSELDFKVIESRKKKKGLETHYSATWSGTCLSCHEQIEVQMDIWEYPKDHRNEMKVTFPGHPQEKKSDFPVVREAPLYDKTGKNVIGTFTIEPKGKNFEVRCWECNRVHEVDIKNVVYEYLEDEESRKGSGTIFHRANWEKACDCGAKLNFRHTTFSELQGIIYDRSVNTTNCDVLSGPELTLVKNIPD